jgi:hypothetical protein
VHALLLPLVAVYILSVSGKSLSLVFVFKIPPTDSGLSKRFRIFYQLLSLMGTLI